MGSCLPGPAGGLPCVGLRSRPSSGVSCPQDRAPLTSDSAHNLPAAWAHTQSCPSLHWVPVSPGSPVLQALPSHLWAWAFNPCCPTADSALILRFDLTASLQAGCFFSGSSGPSSLPLGHQTGQTWASSISPAWGVPGAWWAWMPVRWEERKGQARPVLSGDWEITSQWPVSQYLLNSCCV